MVRQRQFVWGLRYIDDLVLRDRSTANNGVINERRYAMQDGTWNTIAICDITGFVSERFAYSAYGTPVFMTGAGVVQMASAIGFEMLCGELLVLLITVGAATICEPVYTKRMGLSETIRRGDMLIEKCLNLKLEVRCVKIESIGSSDVVDSEQVASIVARAWC